ncbi:MAG: TetR family transcriptional regulator [Sterolibacteriaceae bacterium]|nr:TetR family transcriptional regulator [Candidatus Methylophosphatis haderslevensis]
MDLEVSRPEADTRSRILDAAQGLFVRHGLEATSLRMITARANANIAAAHYHFGSKDALIEAVFRRGLARLNEMRLAELDRLEREAGGGPLKPRQVLEAFFGTALMLAADRDQGGFEFMRLLGRTMTDPNQFIRTFIAAEYQEVMERFKDALFAALPKVPHEEIIWRLHFMLGAMSYALAGTDALRLATGLSGEDDPRAIAPRLMSFLLGGLRAPLAGRPAEIAKSAAPAAAPAMNRINDAPLRQPARTSGSKALARSNRPTPSHRSSK